MKYIFIILLLSANWLFGSDIRFCKIAECQFDKRPDGSKKSDFAMAGVNGSVIKIVDFDRIKFYNEDLLRLYESEKGELVAKVGSVLFYRGFLYADLNSGEELASNDRIVSSMKQLGTNEKILDRDSETELRVVKGSRYTAFIKIDFYSHSMDVMYLEIVTVKNSDVFSTP